MHPSSQPPSHRHQLTRVSSAAATSPLLPAQELRQLALLSTKVEQMSEVALSDDDGDVSGSGDGDDGAAARRREALSRQLALFAKSRVDAAATAAAAKEKKSRGGGGSAAAAAALTPATGLESKPPARCAEQQPAPRQCGRRGGSSVAACLARAPAAAAVARVTMMGHMTMSPSARHGVRLVPPPQLRARPCLAV
jgi:hypothetical protein